MKKSILVSFLTATLVVPCQAFAATIRGPGEISFDGSVILQESGTDPQSGLPLISWDFVFPVGPPDGDLDIFPLDASGGFTEFLPNPGSINIGRISDVALPPSPPVDRDISFIDEPIRLLTLDPEEERQDFYTATFVSPSELDATRFGSSLTFETDGFWTSGAGEIFPGQGIVTSQFPGLNPDQLRARLDSGFGINTAFSASFNATERVTQVPEPSKFIVSSIFVLLLGIMIKRGQVA